MLYLVSYGIFSHYGNFQDATSYEKNLQVLSSRLTSSSSTLQNLGCYMGMLMCGCVPALACLLARSLFCGVMHEIYANNQDLSVFEFLRGIWTIPTANMMYTR